MRPTAIDVPPWSPYNESAPEICKVFRWIALFGQLQAGKIVHDSISKDILGGRFVRRQCRKAGGGLWAALD